MGRDRRMRESNPREAHDAHVRIAEFQNALSQKNESDGQSNKENAARPSGGLEKEAENGAHGRPVMVSLTGSTTPTLSTPLQAM